MKNCWRVVHAAVQGRGHIKSNIPCQDKTYALCLDEGCVIALADGAGSAKFSHYGADAVIRCVANSLYFNFKEYYETEELEKNAHRVVELIKGRLFPITNLLGCKMNDLASTLLVVAVCDEKYVIMHIGDGVVAYLENENLKVASHPANGEFLNTTYFITDSNAACNIRIIKGKLEEISGFMLFSDGVESYMYKHDSKKINQSFLPIFQDINNTKIEDVENNLVDSLNLIKNKSTFDDCSMAVMALCE